MPDVQAYCVKCRTQRAMKNAREVTLDNGRRAVKGVCEVCGTNMTRFLPSEKK